MIVHHDVPAGGTQENKTPIPESVVDFLILGAGWTSTFLLPLLASSQITHAATTTTGRDGTIPFKFDPEDSDPSSAFRSLPHAKTIMITFPLKGTGPSKLLVDSYLSTHPPLSSSSSSQKFNFIQLGVTSIWTSPSFQDENSPHDTTQPRAQAEDELLSLSSSSPSSSSSSSSNIIIGTSVLSLAGLYGGDRQPRNWVDRVIKDKESLRQKGALHVIHGEDVARAVVALHGNFTPGKRWLLCDMHVYDWWDLVQDWALLELREAEAGEAGAKKVVTPERVARQKEMLGWVGELMVEEGVRALPRDKGQVGRALDGRGFWREMGIWPTQGRIR